ncbi:MAG: (2Fe-2S)-binding protein [Dehalococcoidia bacterium]|nr:(2Fe-2S)-binding protein [Dehalococcoidia bacterium]
MKQSLELTVNGQLQNIEVEPQRTLLEVLRDDLGMTGTKRGCDDASCGACTVLLNGKAVLSCNILALEAHGLEILTVEGLAKDGQIHPLQKAFIEHGAIQCGFCTPGMLISAKELLDKNPQPTEPDIKEALAGNLCRCTGYTKIIEAVIAASNAGSNSKP